jgi:hypothetical protein
MKRYETRATEVPVTASPIAVNIDGVSAVAATVLGESQVVARMAESTAVTISSGCAGVDGALAEFVGAWRAQLAGLGALSTALAVALAGAADGYTVTERAIATGYG